MKIDAYNQISQIYQTNNKYKVPSVNKVKATDKVEISEIGKDIQIVKQALKNVPDIREEKVAQIKAGFENGTYQISDEEISEKLLENYNV